MPLKNNLVLTFQYFDINFMHQRTRKFMVSKTILSSRRSMSLQDIYCFFVSKGLSQKTPFSENAYLR